MLKYFLISFIIIFLFPSLHAQLDIGANIESARKEISEGKYQLAINRLNRLIKSKPDLYEAFFYRAISKYSLTDYTGAILDLSTVIELNPFLPEAFYYRGNCQK